MLAEASMAETMKSMMFVLLPLAGSCLLAFGLWQVFADLKNASAKRLLERLTDRASPSRKKDQVIESLLRKNNDQQAAIDMLLEQDQPGAQTAAGPRPGQHPLAGQPHADQPGWGGDGVPFWRCWSCSSRPCTPPRWHWASSSCRSST